MSSAPAAPARSATSRRSRQEWALLAALLAALFVFGAWTRLAAHRGLESQERQRLEVQARAVGENLSRQLVGVYEALHSAREEIPLWGAKPPSATASRELRALSDAMPGVSRMTLLDADGRVVAASRLDLIGSSRADHVAFVAARRRADPSVLLLSPPYPVVPGTLSMDVSLVVPDAAGGFGGVISATLDADYLQMVLDSALYASGMWGAVAHGEGRMLLMQPANPTAAGTDIAVPGSLFTRHRESGQPATVLSGAVHATGRRAMLAQRTVRPLSLPLDAALVVAVGRDLDAMFAPWREQTAILALLYLLFVAASSLGLLALQRRARDAERLQAAQQAGRQEAAERVELALRGGDLGLWDLHLPSGTATVNERWNTMLGRAHQPFERGLWRSLVHPEDGARVDALLQAHLEGRSERYDAVYRLRHADGHWVWVHDRGQVLERDAQGRPLRMVGTHLDISERMQAEEALRHNEERLRSLLDHLPAGVIVHAADGRVLEANPVACQVLGSPVEALREHASFGPGWQVLEEDGSPMAPQRYPVFQVLAQGRPVSNCVVGLMRPGRERPLWTLCNAYPVRRPDGAIDQVIVSFVDMTERVEANEGLRLLGAAVERLNDVVMITEADPVDEPGPRIVFVNAAFERLTGWRREEVIGRSPRLLQGPASDRAEMARIDAARRKREPLHCELVNYTRQGREYWVEIDLVPLADRSGRVTHMVSIERDITERKALERQLRESQKMESIGTLAGGIAHDFNNILAAILGNVALAREDASPTHPVQASLDQINRAGLRARHLVQQILAFSRQEPRGLTAQPLRPVVEETLGLLRATLPAGVRLEARLSEEPVSARVDATQLQQVLMNLCTNAWHALPAQGGCIEVGLETVAGDPAMRVPPDGRPAGPSAHLWVRDDGHGMDVATREHIFEPFFTTKPVGQGTGLGLPVVHGIVRAHGGSITVDSAPGQGSCFHIYLPWAQAEVPEPVTAADAPAPPGGAGRHVLYIDDDEVLVLMVERLLQRAGFRVTTESDPLAAMARLREQPQAFDAVVTDFNMPGLSGLDVARQVAALRPDLPVVISSGYLSEELRRQASAVGVRGTLKKENTLEELTDLLLSLLA